MLPEPAANAACAKAGERYDQFDTVLDRRLAGGPKLRRGISEDVASEPLREAAILPDMADQVSRPEGSPDDPRSAG